MDIDEDYMENVGAPAPAGKAKAKSKAQPLAANNGQNSKSIEEMYQKKSQLEHILLRPDTYIGSTEKQQQALWVHNGEKMELKTISYVPGLYKIFDEILVNAADHKVRDPNMDTLKVTIDVDGNSITVWNNGSGIPVEVHKEEGVYVPELIFGHLLTSSNYDDNEKKIVGGRNGYGAKLANIFSTEFILETCDGTRQRRYKQTFTANMTKKGTPKVSDCKATDNWTSITFKPDLAKFGMQELEEDTVALMRKRVYDMAGILGKTCKVFLNGTRIAIKSFQEYVDLYLGPKDNGIPRIYEKYSDRWEVCVSTTDGQFQQVSFVNSICTYKGGTHVNYLVDQITKHVVEKLNKKNKNANVKPFMVKNHLWVFINSYIENPAFDSQTKENLTLRASSFGSKCDLQSPFLDKIAKSGLMDSILSFAEFKNQKEMKKNDGAKRSRLLGITKLDDANNAGGRSSQACTLILTEGDSAKSLAISGLGVVGRDSYGVFPLRGKLLNVREASAAQVSGNAEITHIKQILGLQHGKVYEDTKSLRYGHLMIMTDQDHDGSHIKGLIMNFLHTFYPSLLKLPSFLQEFITPIVKARKDRQVISFYTMPEYEAWKERVGAGIKSWDIKYYKGLGTSTKDEAREYFSALERHRKEFVWEGEDDGAAIELAFSKKKVDERKEWLANYEPGTYLDMTPDTISYSDFINKELILFSRADLERSIPSAMDGLKPGQRKILYASFKRNLKKDIKVAQLASYVSEHSAYHHGEQSLATTIVNLAQDFVGSNNVFLLFPSGQFGTRLQGGKDAASSRYIYTRLAPLTRHLFNESDDRLLAYLNEEGQSIEPEWYIPILPTVLMNGAEGIGTGWSTSIPNYNPRDIVANLKALLNGEEQQPIHPWYRGFNGTIVEVPNRTGARSYVCTGIISQVDDNTVEIRELPVRKWTQDYKEFLEGMMRCENKDETPLVAEYTEHHSDAEVHFKVTLNPGKMAEVLASKEGLTGTFKLSAKFATSNMMLFDSRGVIKQYNSPEHVIEDFYPLRLDYYERRRLALLKAAQEGQVRIDSKVRFIRAVVSGELKVSNRKKADIEAELEAKKYPRMAASRAKAAKAAAEEVMNEDEDGDAAAASPSGLNYDYLLSMPIYSLTVEKIQALEAEAQQQAAVVASLHAATAQSMWHEDLDAFLEAYAAWEKGEDERAQEASRLLRQAGKGKGAKAKKAAPAKARKKQAVLGSDDEEMDDVDDDDDDFEDDDDFKPAKKAPAAKKPAAPKPAAPAAAPGAAAAKPAAAAAAVPKAAAAPKAAKAPAQAVAAPQPAASTDETASEDVMGGGLAARLAGRFNKLTVKSASGSGGSGAAAAAAGPSKPPAAAARAAPGAYGLEDDSDDGEVNSPARPPPKSKTAPKASRLGAGAKSTKGADEDSKPVKRKGTAAAKPAAAAAGKGRNRRVVSDSDEEDDISIATTSESEADEADEDVYELEAPSPAVAPKGKKSKVGPSPLHMKALSRTAGLGLAAAAPAPAALAPAAKAAPAAKPAAKPKPTAKPKPAPQAPVALAAVDEDEDAEEQPQAAPAPRAARPQRAAAGRSKPINLAESDDDEDDDEAIEVSSDDANDSDFQDDDE